MILVNSFTQLLQELAIVMTVRSFDNFQSLVVGWVFAPRRTVSSMLLAAGLSAERHHAAYYRFFAQASWSLDALGLAVFRLLEKWLTNPVMLAVDDTLARKRGLKIFGVGMHHDPLLSSRGKAITNWGHSWVVLGVMVRFPLWEQRVFCLPILFRLYLNQEKAIKHKRAYRTRPELAVQMLKLLCNHRQNRQFHLVADSAYGGQSVLSHLPVNCHLTSRLLMNARLYDLPKTRQPGTKGRPRKFGRQLPTPQEMLQSRSRRITLDIYGRHDSMRLAETVASVHSEPTRPLQVIAVEPLTGGRKPQVFFSTRLDLTAEQSLSHYAMRWSIEVAFHDSKQHLGFEEPQGWSRRAAERTAPMAMLLYSLIVLWFVNVGHHDHQSLCRPWYRRPHHPSFADMLATLRRKSIRDHISQWGLSGPGSRKVLQALENMAAVAA